MFASCNFKYLIKFRRASKMLSYKRYTVFAIVFVMVLFLLQTNVFAQKKCIFFSTQAPEEDRDKPLVTKLSETYTVEVYSIDDLGGWVDSTLLHEYDFAFVSESIASARGGGLKGGPIPVFNMELWGSKWDIMGWVPYNWNPDYYGTTGDTENKVMIMDGSHPLAAGFFTGAEVEIVTPIAGSGALTYSVPQIEIIQIGVLSADPNKTIVFGVEAGTVLYNDVNTIDGSLVSENRIACVGVMAGLNGNITDDGWKLIHAGIDWITEGGASAVESESNLTPSEFRLEQNYPNPFNPSTSIRFTLKEAGNVTLKVFDLLGNEVATLIDGDYKSIGSHTVNFDAHNLTSGVYFYKLESGNFSAIKKMSLVK
ncbi:T9SS type A sorting domain-containing protein [candidate division KSB1 bacterium]|nr:T9SS type A sorting domain-containing protein [candidate division KSB1 bacterium]